VDSLAKTFESFLGAGAFAFNRAKNLSGGIIKGFVKGLATVIKIFLKK